LVAIDGPTGICADTGRRLGEEAATAAVTYAIGLIKQGFVQDAGLAWVGRLERIDLGLPAALLAGLPPEQPLGLGLTADLAEADQRACPWPAIDPAAPKYGRGRLLVVAGSRRYRGAALLALAGASAAGCGSLRAALPAAVAESLWAVQPHVVLEPPLAATADDGLDLGSLPPASLERLDAVLLGPGLGGTEGPDASATWRRLQELAALLVIDADGLNRLAAGVAGAATPAAWLRRRGGPTWITPHAGEFARLFPEHAALPPLEAAARAAQESGAVVLLKGARSVVAAPDGRRWQLLRACGQAARAGLGDVLAGYAAARGAMAMAAGDGDVAAHHLAAAALDHGQAGWVAVQREGAGGATPGAVAEALSRSGAMCGFAITSEKVVERTSGGLGRKG
jgi:NAD(P)H-hydrate epimerase